MKPILLGLGLGLVSSSWPVLAGAQPAPPDATKELKLEIRPFATVVGGLKADTLLQEPNGQRQGRVSAIALSDFGILASVGPHVSVVSELMANGGTSLHGSSTFEGQAALQVRRQLVRYKDGMWMGEVGRIVDEASLNYFSSHVMDTMLQDIATREPLLYSGFNMGNGIRGTVEPYKDEKSSLRLGLTFTAGNPVATTSSLQIGGAFTPFDRFYIQPYQNVKQQPNNFPDDTFHIMLLSPSLMYTSPYFETRLAFQGYVVDTNTNRRDDQNLHGYNLRGSVKGKILDDTIAPFANVAFNRNDTVTATDTSQLSADKYTSVVIGGGIDLNYAHVAPDRPSGIGFEYDLVQYQVGAGAVTRLHYVNIGTTYWINPFVAFGARFAGAPRQDISPDVAERSVLFTMRTVL